MDARKIIDYAWIAIGMLWLISSVTSKPTLRRQSTGSRIVQACLTIAAFFLLFDSDLAIGPLGWRFVAKSAVVSWIGAAITVSGILVALWARFLLGRNWSANVTIKRDHQLIRTGPYALVRHPIYSGFSLAILGTAIAFGEIRDLIALVLAVTGWRLKLVVEEQFMMEQFGAEYVDYKRHVKALVPFVW
jgi:protein-S-isoprenylcysteine O-methyltransferase Ste14